MAKQSFRSSATEITKRLISILSSNYFFYGVLVLCVLQALWYALSFTPSLFDEPKHLGRIDVYTQQLSPFFNNQKAAWDQFGQMTRDSFYFFYYIMSWPLRFIRLLTDNQSIHIIFLRLLNIGAFTLGLFYFRKAFMQIRQMPSSIINISLLLLVLTPTIAILPGAVNYDNFVFLLFGILLYFGLRIVDKNKPTISDTLKFFAVGLLMVMVKWTSTALFVPAALYIGWSVYGKYDKSIRKLFKHNKQVFKKTGTIALICIMLLLSALIIERPLLNQIKYGKAKPGCEQIISYERCLDFHDFAIYDGVRAGIPTDFSPVGVAEYTTIFWYPRMINTLTTVLPWNAVRLTRALPVITELFFASAIVVIVLISSNLRRIFRHSTLRMLLFVAVTFIFILIIKLYGSYVRNAVPAAIHGRYLLPILPILLSFTGLSIVRHLGKFKKTLLLSGFVLLLFFSQGGGIVTHSITAHDRLYWNNEEVKKINTELRDILKTYVKEG